MRHLHSVITTSFDLNLPSTEHKSPPLVDFLHTLDPMYRDTRDAAEDRQARRTPRSPTANRSEQRPAGDIDDETYPSTPSDHYERPDSSSSALRGRFDSLGFSARRRSHTSGQLELAPPPVAGSSRPIAPRPNLQRRRPNDSQDSKEARPHSSSGVAVESRLPPVPQHWGFTYSQPPPRTTTSSFAKPLYPPNTAGLPAVPPGVRMHPSGYGAQGFALAAGGAPPTNPGSSPLTLSQSVGASSASARPASSGRRPYEEVGSQRQVNLPSFGHSPIHQQLGPPHVSDRPEVRRRSNTTQVEGIRPWYGATGSVHDTSHHGIPPAPEAAPPNLAMLPLMDPELEPRSYKLRIRQQPSHGRMFGFRSRERRPLDPLPIVELTIRDRHGDVDWLAQSSPDLLMQVSLITDVAHEDELVSSSANPSATTPQSRLLEGKLASSGHMVKDLDGARACFFLFPDLSVRVESMASLHFSLIRLGGPMWQSGGAGPAGRVVAEVTSDPFQIHSPRTYPGIGESTELAKCLAAQGVAVPIRNQGRK